jgi:hypothetical protein
MLLTQLLKLRINLMGLWGVGVGVSEEGREWVGE